MNKPNEYYGYALKTKGKLNGIITYEIYASKENALLVSKEYGFDVVKVKIIED